MSLPMCWKRGSAHDHRLPDGFADIADNVIEELRRTNHVNGEWGLHLDLEAELHGCRIDASSAFAALVGGLLLTVWEGEPRPDVWATGAWYSRGGLREIDGVEEKLLAAAELGCRVFAAPGAQVEIAQDFVDKQRLAIEVVSLRHGQVDPRLALTEYLERLQVPPGRHDPSTLRAQYYLNISDSDRAREYYRKTIFEDVVLKCRDDLQSTGQECRNVGSLVTVVSHGWEIVLVAAGVFQPRRVLLLHDRNSAEFCRAVDTILTEVRKAKEEYSSDGNGFLREIEFVPVPFEERRFPGMVCEFGRLLREHAAEDPTVVDVTPGTKTMSLALWCVAPRASRFIYWQHSKVGARVIPFEERPELFGRDALDRLSDHL
jgi:hypothetical protein